MTAIQHDATRCLPTFILRTLCRFLARHLADCVKISACRLSELTSIAFQASGLETQLNFKGISQHVVIVPRPKVSVFVSLSVAGYVT